MTGSARGAAPNIDCVVDAALQSRREQEPGSV
jgi:hypothetical protein